METLCLHWNHIVRIIDLAYLRTFGEKTKRGWLLNAALTFKATQEKSETSGTHAQDVTRASRPWNM